MFGRLETGWWTRTESGCGIGRSSVVVLRHVFLVDALHVLKSGEFLEEGERDISGLAVAAFGYGKFDGLDGGLPGTFVGEHPDGISVLADGAGLAKFTFVVQLGEGENGDVEFEGDGFETLGDGGDTLFAVITGCGDELKIIDDNELERLFLVQASGESGDLSDG